MTKPPKKPSSDPHVAAFRALRDAKKSFMPGTKAQPKTQKPRAKQQLRRRP